MLVGRPIARAEMIRTYARIVGILLVLVGLLGATGVIATALPAEVFHGVMGLFFVYLGFLQRDVEVVRDVVGGIGVLLVLVKGVIILGPLLWGEAPYHGPVEITCLVVGISSILAARFFRTECRRGGEP